MLLLLDGYGAALYDFPPVGVRSGQNVNVKKLRTTIPDSVGTFVSDFGTPVALGPAKGPEGLVAACLLLDAQAAPWFPNDLINRLKYYPPPPLLPPPPPPP